jgi:hypothetical protein
MCNMFSRFIQTYKHSYLSKLGNGMAIAKLYICERSSLHWTSFSIERKRSEQQKEGKTLCIKKRIWTHTQEVESK